MKVKIAKTKQIHEEIEVEFPLYSWDMDEGYQSWTKFEWIESRQLIKETHIVKYGADYYDEIHDPASDCHFTIEITYRKSLNSYRFVDRDRSGEGFENTLNFFLNKLLPPLVSK